MLKISSFFCLKFLLDLKLSLKREAVNLKRHHCLNLLIVTILLSFICLFCTQSFKANNRNNNELIVFANDDSGTDVSNWSQLNNALLNKDVTTINVKADIVNNELSFYLNRYIPQRSIKINGNNHYIDFRGISFYNGNAVQKNTTVQIDINNLKMYGQNYYGPFTYSGATSSKSATNRPFGDGYIRYKDSSYEGAQLTASYTYDIIFAGTVSNKSAANSYVSPADNATYRTQGIPQVNIEATNIIFEPNANYIGSTEGAGVFVLRNNGGISLGENSNVSLSTFNNNGGSGENDDSVLTLDGGISCGKGAKLSINTRKDRPQSAINIKGNLSLDNASQLNVIVDDQFNTTGQSTNVAVINIPSSSLKISQSATLAITGNIKRSGLSKYLTVGIINQTGNSQLEVNQDGNLLIDLKGSSKYLSVFKSPSSSSISLNSAKLVDINLNNIAADNTVNLFEISGNFSAKLQKISAWNSTNTKNPNYIWDSVYSLNVNYTNSGSTAVAQSNSQATIDSLKNNYQTQNFGHLRFEGYPDISIDLDFLTDLQTMSNSYTLQGQTEPNALVTFSGDRAIPNGSLSSYNLADKSTKYHTVADANGFFSFQLPKNNYFTSGNIVKATAFSKSSGKTVSTTQKVLTKTELPKDSDFLQIVSASNINFGNFVIRSQKQRLFSIENQAIVIQGIKTRRTPWQLNFKISPLKTANQEILPSQYFFGDTILNTDSAITVYNEQTIEAKLYSVTFTPSKGLNLNVDLNQVNAEQYSSQATWSVVIGP